MNKILILILTFLPLALLGQELKCCENINEVETFLDGNWKKKDSEPNRQYHYKFNDGIGTLEVFDINKSGDLVKVENNLLTIKILKTKKGFEIEHFFDVVKTYTGIKFLDSKKLIVMRRDGKEMEYSKITD